MAREYSPNSFANKYGYFVIFPLRFSLIGKIKRSFNGEGGYSRNLRITFIDCVKHFLFRKPIPTNLERALLELFQRCTLRKIENDR